MQIVTVSVEELETLIERAVERAIRPTREDWLDTQACADYLATTQNSVRDLVRRQGLPAHRSPGTSRLLFRPSEIDSWIRGGGSLC
jgi:excisionase family DNA binding protein